MHGSSGQFSFLEPARPIVLVTAHRRESFGAGFEEICRSLRDISEQHQVQIVYPVHPNPSVREPAERLLAGAPFIHLIDPLDYEPFVFLMERSHVIITDSGGIQEEAPSLGKPVLVTRERPNVPRRLARGVPYWSEPLAKESSAKPGGFFPTPSIIGAWRKPGTPMATAWRPRESGTSWRRSDRHPIAGVKAQADGEDGVGPGHGQVTHDREELGLDGRFWESRLVLIRQAISAPMDNPNGSQNVIQGQVG